MIAFIVKNREKIHWLLQTKLTTRWKRNVYKALYLKCSSSFLSLLQGTLSRLRRPSTTPLAILSRFYWGGRGMADDAHHRTKKPWTESPSTVLCSHQDFAGSLRMRYKSISVLSAFFLFVRTTFCHDNSDKCDRNSTILTKNVFSSRFKRRNVKSSFFQLTFYVLTQGTYL